MKQCNCLYLILGKSGVFRGFEFKGSMEGEERGQGALSIEHFFCNTERGRKEKKHTGGNLGEERDCEGKSWGGRCL